MNCHKKLPVKPHEARKLIPMLEAFRDAGGSWTDDMSWKGNP